MLGRLAESRPSALRQSKADVATALPAARRMKLRREIGSIGMDVLLSWKI
jgi:hypothetical protein